jgi:hypothetical protein
LTLCDLKPKICGADGSGVHFAMAGEGARVDGGRNVAKITTRTSERLLTREEVASTLPRVTLTPEEEIVIRLRYGLGMQPEEKLSFRGKGNDELEAKLALIEKTILDQLEAEAEGHSNATDIDDHLKHI